MISVSLMYTSVTEPKVVDKVEEALITVKTNMAQTPGTIPIAQFPPIIAVMYWTALQLFSFILYQYKYFC